MCKMLWRIIYICGFLPFFSFVFKDSYGILKTRAKKFLSSFFPVLGFSWSNCRLKFNCRVKQRNCGAKNLDQLVWHNFLGGQEATFHAYTHRRLVLKVSGRGLWIDSVNIYTYVYSKHIYEAYKNMCFQLTIKTHKQRQSTKVVIWD